MIAQNYNDSLKQWCFYLVNDSICLLDADWLSPLICINIGVLFSIIQAVKVCCDILFTAAGIIHNGGRCKRLVAGSKIWQELKIMMPNTTKDYQLIMNSSNVVME